MSQILDIQDTLLRVFDLTRANTGTSFVEYIIYISTAFKPLVVKRSPHPALLH